jgi:formylglycine-generating enzyme required for sulfatase activity
LSVKMSSNIKSMESEMVRMHRKSKKSIKIRMIHLPRGHFTMGEEGNQKEVTIEYEFEIGKYPVTVEEYMAFVQETNAHYPEWLEEGNEYSIKTGTDEHYTTINQDKKAPIVGVSWHDAVAYCKWLSLKSGREFRLPTEAEWEYACRAGTETKWSFGDNEGELKEYGWYAKNSHGQASIVGLKRPNPWGVYDMHGNVWEWCSDDWVETYKDTPGDGRAYRSRSSSLKVLRSGSWSDLAFLTSSALRDWSIPEFRANYMGFRILRALPFSL